MALQIEDLGSRWETFFQEVKLQEIQLLTNNSIEFRIRFNDIQSWDPEFAKKILNQPKRTILTGKRILSQRCKENGLNIEPDILLEHLPPDVEDDLREIGSDDLNRLRCVNVVITKVSEIRPRIYEADWCCDSCNGHTVVTQENELELKEPLICSGCELPASGAGSTRFTLDSDRCTWINNQYLEIQELPERVKGSGQPSRGKVLIEGIQCNRFLPGERVTANLIPYTQAGYHRNRKSAMFEIVYSLHSAVRESTPFTDIQPSEEEKMEIKKVASRPDLMAIMQESIAPSIIDVTDKLKVVKRSLLMQLFGGVSRINADGTRNRGDIHILLMGDPGVAKSQLLTYMSKLAPRARFASGGNISAAGLTAAAIRDSFGDGRFTLEAGVLPLADLGIACIDEIDKISNEDKGSLHEAMEQQQISVSKGGITTQLRARCAVLSAANPTKGTFDVGPNQNLMYAFNQTGLPIPLATRFDIIWLMKDRVDEENDASIARHIMASRIKGVPESKVEENTFENPVTKDEEVVYKTNTNGKEYLSVPFLRKYIAYAKTNHSPTLTDEAKSMILDYYKQARHSYGKDSEELSERRDEQPIPISARALESLIRLAEAHARMNLRDEVIGEDADMAIAIFRHWREEENVGSVAEMSTGSSHGPAQMNRIVMKIVKDIVSETGKDAMQNEIYSRALTMGIEDTIAIDSAIQRLSIDTQLLMSRPGQWRTF
tara:strand:- start:365 stop:2515 length:2151 start_codon:yes stop_codon:yes gene_type:complete